MSDSLAKLLDIEPIEKVPPKKLEQPTEPDTEKEIELTKDASDDYVLAREVIRDMVEKGKDAVGKMAELAEQSESARAFEVLATLMKTVSETTKDLYDIHKKTKELKEPTGGRAGRVANPIAVDKAVFVGTTSDLLKQVKGE